MMIVEYVLATQIVTVEFQVVKTGRVSRVSDLAWVSGCVLLVRVSTIQTSGRDRHRRKLSNM